MITVSRISRHQSQRKKVISQPGTKRKQSTSRVIHVLIGLPSTIPPTKNNRHPVMDKVLTKNRIFSVHRRDQQLLSQTNSQTESISKSTDKSIKRTDSFLKLSRVSHHRVISSKVDPREFKTRNIELSDETGLTNDHHRKPVEKRKHHFKCTRRCFIVSLILMVIIVAIVLSVTLALLLKSQTKTRPATTPALRWNSTGITVAGIVGDPGNASNQLNRPLDVTLDWNHNVYIPDYYNHRIQKYSSDSSVGVTIAGNGILGLTPSQLYYPSRVLIDANENLYISDALNYRVQLWNKGATNGTTIAGTTGSPGNASNQLNVSFGITLDPTSSVLYVSDYYNHRIMLYPSGVKNGTLLFGGRGPGSNATQLCYPGGLQYDSFANNLIIANFGCQNIVRYVFGATNWALVAGNINAIPGAGPASLHSPMDIALDSMGNTYVADRANHRIQFFADGAVNGTTIAGISGVSGNSTTTLSTPWGVGLDSQLNVYVADTLNHRVQKFLRY